MDGVTILNTIVLKFDYTINIVGLIVAVIIFAISLCCAYVSIKELNGLNILTLICIFLMIGSTMFGIINIELMMTSKEITTYEVTISEEVLFKDFTSKYEIIEQRGDIYVIKEREENKQ